MKRALGSIAGGFLGAALFFAAISLVHPAQADNPPNPLPTSFGGTNCSGPDAVLLVDCFVDTKRTQEIAGQKTFDQPIVATQGVIMGPGYVTGTGVAILGDIQAASDSASFSRIPPFYNIDSTAMPATFHGVFFTKTLTISGTCATLTLCTLTGGTTVALTGTAAPFFSAATGFCWMSQQTGTASSPFGFAELNAAATIQLALFNETGVGITGSYAGTGVCIGW